MKTDRPAKYEDEGKSMMDDFDENPEIEINDTTPDEDEPVMQDPFNPAEINIVPKQDTLRNLIERLRYKEIEMATDFQRHAELWDVQKMSRLIESILIRFPLPAFYFDASDEDKWLVVDGLQRLSSIRKFVVETDEKKKLKLRGMEYLKEYIGKTYGELPRTYQRKIDECPVTLFLIQPVTPPNVKYSIFRRINTGGLVLTDQEIRNAMAKPEIREFLKRLAADEYLIKTVGDQSKRMLDQELVLRFFAFHFMEYETSRKNITTFLDEMVEKLKKSDSRELDIYEKTFRLAIQRCWQIFDDSAFEKRTAEAKGRRRRKNSTLFEVWTVALAKLNESDMDILIQKKENLLEKNIEMMTNDNEYFRSITYSTQKRDHFRIRRDKVNALIQEVLNA
jgi:hypothetical protein